MQGQESSGQSSEQETSGKSYVGIDVCQDWLDIHILPAATTLRVANSEQGHRLLKRRLEAHEVELTAIEATGKWHRKLHRSLHASGYRVAVVNPLRARLFAEATGGWRQAGIATSSLPSIDARGAELLRAALGQAAGCRWYLDRKMRDDSEFTTPGKLGEAESVALGQKLWGGAVFGPRIIDLSWTDGRRSGEELHGTSNPRQLGEDVSHGCVRHANEDIVKLSEALSVGDHVAIVSGLKDARLRH